MKIYVATSWRNRILQNLIVKDLRLLGHDVYDFTNPAPDKPGFSWSFVDVDWRNWSNVQFVEGLNHPAAEVGFNLDMNALRACDVCVMLMPCGKSAHLELGFAAGAGKCTVILVEQDHEPELMYKMADKIITDRNQLYAFIGRA